MEMHIQPSAGTRPRQTPVNDILILSPLPFECRIQPSDILQNVRGLALRTGKFLFENMGFWKSKEILLIAVKRRLMIF